MNLAPAQIAAACGCPLDRAARWAPYLTEAANTWGIDTPTRLAAWLAQVAHESGRLVYVRELWGPSAAQAGYEGRADIGNTTPGDGFRYRGRGLIQVTGRANYRACTSALRQRVGSVAPDFVQDPAALEQPQWAAHSAGWFWQSRDLNAPADIGDFQRITRRVNGGLNGYADRLVLWGNAKAALEVA